MNETAPFVITISRMPGSGGAYIGQWLANKLKMLYVDREIVAEAARDFSLLETDLEEMEERIESLWVSLLQHSALGNPFFYIPPQLYVPTERQLFEAESEIIRRTASQQSCVIIGRCGSHVLRTHPNHCSIFLYASTEFRNRRLQEIYKLSEHEAEKKIKEMDAARSRYRHEFTGRDWKDATQYDLAINTGRLGIDRSAELILKYIELRFGRMPA